MHKNQNKLRSRYLMAKSGNKFNDLFELSKSLATVKVKEDKSRE